MEEDETNKIDDILIQFAVDIKSPKHDDAKVINQAKQQIYEEIINLFGEEVIKDNLGTTVNWVSVAEIKNKMKPLFGQEER
jgi:hypothetical protein